MPIANAVVLYLMDVSGSMTDDQKEIVRIEAFWIDTWLKSQYDGVTTRYIIHDAVAREVDQHTFYHTRESGGTRISSAYNLANKIIDADHPAATGTSTSSTFPTATTGARTTATARLLRDQLLPKCNLFGYGQVESPYGSGEFYRDSKKPSTTCPTWPSPRSATRKGFTSRSRNSSDAGANAAFDRSPLQGPLIRTFPTRIHGSHSASADERPYG